MFPRLGEVEQANDTGVVEPAHDRDFLEDVGALWNGRGRKRRARAMRRQRRESGSTTEVAD